MSVREFASPLSPRRRRRVFCHSYDLTEEGYAQRLRSEARAELLSHSDDKEAVDDTVLAISEAATNFCSYVGGISHITVEIWVRPEACLIRVSHDGPAVDPSWLDQAEKELVKRLEETGVPYRQEAIRSRGRRSLGCGLHLIQACCSHVRASPHGLSFDPRLH